MTLTIRGAAQLALDNPEQSGELAARMAIKFNSTQALCLDAIRQMAGQIKSGEERARIAAAARQRIEQRYHAEFFARQSRRQG